MGSSALSAIPGVMAAAVIRTGGFDKGLLGFRDAGKRPLLQAVEKEFKIPHWRRRAALNIHQQGFERLFFGDPRVKKAFFNSLLERC